MECYKKLRLFRDRLVLIPGLSSYKDFDISIEIGHYEHLGTPLTLKQLLLLDIAAEATVRRHLKILIQQGMVVKSVNPIDNRSVVLKLTENAHKLFHDCTDELMRIMREFDD